MEPAGKLRDQPRDRRSITSRGGARTWEFAGPCMLLCLLCSRAAQLPLQRGAGCPACPAHGDATETGGRQPPQVAALTDGVASLIVTLLAVHVATMSRSHRHCSQVAGLRISG